MQYDICVIGGGIQGCGVAQAGAAAGYRVVVIEKAAIASATSSRSSKLIHGGLRYLESGQFHLVAESLRERDLLLRLAPELVHRVPFYIPVYRSSSRRSWQIFLGLSLYALLGKLRATACFRKLDHRDWHTLDQLDTQYLKTVYQYWDAQTDDVQLTHAVMNSAIELGGELHCPAEFIAANYDGQGYRIEYRKNGESCSLQARVLVNAAGPWVGQCQSHITPFVAAPAIDLVQGAHIVIDNPAPRGIYYVESPLDRRAVFIMPWHGKTLVGTTETQFEGDPNNITPTEHEIEYLLGIVRYYFPAMSQHVIDSFAGARVLPKMESGPFNRPRDTIFFSNAELPGYLALMGGKLTGYRATAHRAVRELVPWLGARKPVADTRTLVLKPVDRGGC